MEIRNPKSEIQNDLDPGPWTLYLVQVYLRRIRRDRRLLYLSLAFMAVAVVWALGALLYYLDRAPRGWVAGCLFLTALLPAAALAVEHVRRPSLGTAARELDKLIDNQQRTLTALELLGDPQPPHLAAAQLATTARMLERLDPRAPLPSRHAAEGWPIWSLGVGLVFVALALLMLKGVMQPFSPLQAGTLPPELEANAALASPTPASGLPDSERTPDPTQAAQADHGTPAAGQGDQTPGATDPADAANQATASQDAQAALQRLAEALNEQSATQQAADNLRQGNYDQAGKDLSELGEQNDQLSPAAKQGLAEALQKAADDPATNPTMRDAEQAAADALRNGKYDDIEKALKGLAGATQQTAADIVPQQELAKNYPTPSPATGESQQGAGQQGDQGDQQQSASQGGQGQQDQGSQQGEQGSQGQGQQGGESQDGQQSQSGQQGQGGQQGNQDQQGRQGGQAAGGGQDDGNQGTTQNSSAGEGHRVTGPVDPSRPSGGTNPFELEAPADPNKTRPADQNDHPALTLGTGGSAGQPSAPSSGGAVTASGESNRLPVERWRVIERYFSK